MNKGIFPYILIYFFGLNIAIAQQPVAQKITVPPIPASLEFAGEKVPLNNPVIYEQLEQELIKNVYKHSSTLMILNRVARYKEKMIAILTKNKIPEDFFYLSVIESELWPYANSGKAAGFWQFRD